MVEKCSNHCNCPLVSIWLKYVEIRQDRSDGDDVIVQYKMMYDCVMSFPFLKRYTLSKDQIMIHSPCNIR